MALPESWHIRSRARVCTATGRPFEDGETIVTALFPDAESSGYVRLDFCLEAWKARTPEDDKPFSFWKAVYQAPAAGPEKPDSFKKESPEDLLRRLVEEEEEHTENVRYILAVMLERKKVLRETDTQRTPSGIIRVYEHRKLGDVFIVRDPDIPLDQIEKVQDEVFMLLESGGRLAEEEPVALEGEAAGEETVPEEGDATPEVVEEAVSEDAPDDHVAVEEAADESSPKESDSERV
ncbi:hypothetical protein [Luteolibacter sp. Populi]|uniref:hypothetical protein n=1 Tax=Luteolibacter sp. Populi TaxID=3230487 RepID=UPI00346741DC